MLKTDKKIRIIRGDAFSINFYRYFEDKKLSNFRQSMRERKFTVGKSDISYRVINHWESKNLLPDGLNGESGEWRKFTFVEMVWLKVVSHLRKFGVSLEMLALIKDDLMKWNSEDNSYQLFEYYIAKARASKDDPYIVIWSDGQADIVSTNELNLSRMFFSDEDKLLIALKPIISEMGLPAYESELPTVTSTNEDRVLDAIRFGGNKEVKVRVNDEEITEMETIKVHSDNASMKDVNKKLKDKKFYGEKIEKIEEGVKQSIIEKRRYRFK